eukprot:jgi/Mesen1/2463/ME000158S01661
MLRSITGLLWGKGLPPGMLVHVAREVWTALWRTMMGQLAPSSQSGAYQRPSSAFRDRVAPALSCPWAHRALIVHSLKGLGDAVPLSVAVKDVYASREGGYDGRCTVPMLWDGQSREVVNNESADIIQILNSTFNDYAKNPTLDLAPPGALADMAKWDHEIYHNVNNGVYRCGFAQSQQAYDEAEASLFASLDKIDAHLAGSRFLCGDDLTLSDVRLFTTLYRFDAAYYILFKCCRQKVSEYEHLSRYLRDIYEANSGSGGDAITQSYFGTLFPLNPGGIVPAIPRSVPTGV